MAVRRKKAMPLPQAIAAVTFNITDLTVGLSTVNEALQGLVEQVSRFSSLTRAVHAPRGGVQFEQPQDGPLAAIDRAAGVTSLGSVQLSPGEISKREMLLAQFKGRGGMREQIEEDMENGA